MKLKSLSNRITNLSSKSGTPQRSASLGALSSPCQPIVSIVEELVEDLLDMAMEQTANKTKNPVCHHCHAPRNDPVHVGVPCGVGACTNDHWQGCSEGITEGKDKKGKVWTACPEELSSDDDDTDQEETVERFQVRDELPKSVAEAAAMLEKVLDDESLRHRESDFSDDSDIESEDEELRHQREEYERLQKEVEQQALSRKAAEKSARRAERQQRLAIEKAELARKMKDLKIKQAALDTPSPRTPGVVLATTGNAAAGRNLKHKISEHEAKKQRKAAAKLPPTNQVEGITIGGIRTLPDVRQEVEGYISKLKALVPSLATDPTATGFSRSTFQPAGVLGGAPHGMKQKSEMKSKYVYVAELGRAIPVVASLSDLPSASPSRSRPVPGFSSSEEDSECSEDEDCQLQPAEGMRFFWKKHEDGVKFFKQVPVQIKTPELIATYQLDEDTGNYEKVMIPMKTQIKKKSLKTPVYRDHRVSKSKGVKVPVVREERVPSFVSRDPEKQGKESRVPSLVKFARDCPVSWTNKVTSIGLNPVLFSWAYFAELLATRTGQSPALKDGELEARIQHFLSVMEVTLQTTEQTDFGSNSWKVARLYHQKVQDKVDAGVYSWLHLASQWGTATLPHELMAANAELAPKPFSKKRNLKTRENGDTDSGLVLGLCSSWNNCEVRGKCKWEVENDGRKCKYQHYCSWCKRDHNQVNFHQKSFCKKKQDKDGD